ncbi:hypothetical protein N657DRAFT_686256 [Parathielavia appendiculata]|uniref:Uncharacterized protein n=1 Tax=Parathielavia appendiculata TaxID=2587402 RepID=A0AAN6U960_9PEZI|nr:hypothetical protein N657DRAFT_686256 [Parathielavia appendiculata]
MLLQREQELDNWMGVTGFPVPVVMVMSYACGYAYVMGSDHTSRVMLTHRPLLQYLRSGCTPIPVI